MKFMKLLWFALLLLYAFGTIAGIGYSLSHGEWWVSIGIAALSVMAFPTAKILFEKIKP